MAFINNGDRGLGLCRFFYWKNCFNIIKLTGKNVVSTAFRGQTTFFGADSHIFTKNADAQLGVQS